MARKIVQYRYYGDNSGDEDDNKNEPKNINKENMYASGSKNIFINDEKIQEDGMITHLGIQGLPGTKVYINENKAPIIIGGTGVFELDLTDYSFIYRLQIDNQSAELIEQNENGYLIIDAIYDTEV